MIWPIVLAVLATYRVSHLIVAEDGPADVFLKIRDLIYAKGNDNWVERGFSCVLCVSFWLSWLFALSVNEGNYAINALAISCGCLIINRIIYHE